MLLTCSRRYDGVGWNAGGSSLAFRQCTGHWPEGKTPQRRKAGSHRVGAQGSSPMRLDETARGSEAEVRD